ncbi:hypothetical protein M1O54_08155, partial [Dehalococcoidia bacterium]|nr:hypothetical protein [Dehalococcoidia bacterium]
SPFCVELIEASPLKAKRSLLEAKGDKNSPLNSPQISPIGGLTEGQNQTKIDRGDKNSPPKIPHWGIDRGSKSNDNRWCSILLTLLHSRVMLERARIRNPKSLRPEATNGGFHKQPRQRE